MPGGLNAGGAFFAVEGGLRPNATTAWLEPPYPPMVCYNMKIVFFSEFQNLQKNGIHTNMNINKTIQI